MQKIGVLLPRSDMFPALAKDFLNGLNLAFGELKDTSILPKLIIESVGNAADPSLLGIAEKMILQEEVDLTLAFCSIFQLERLVKIFDSFKQPLIHIDLGGNVLKKEHKSPYVLHHTLNVWQSSYLSGLYAAKKFGKNAALALSFYDGGYQLADSFVKGFNNGGGDIVSTYVSPMDYKSETFETMIDGLQSAKPDVVFLLFSYKEATKVFDVLSKSQLNGIVPIIAGAMMTDESTHLEDYNLENVYSVASWSFADDTLAQVHFQQKNREKYNAQPNVISLLGYEVGLTINACFEKINKVPENIAEFVKSLQIISPRGEIIFTSYNESLVSLNNVRKFEFNENHYQNTVIDKVEDSDSQKLYEVLQDLPYTGWQNPYICT